MNDIRPRKRRPPTQVASPSASPLPSQSDVLPELPTPLSDETLATFESTPDPELVAVKPLRALSARWKKALLGFAALVVAFIIAGFVWYSYELSPVDAKSQQQVVVTLPQGSTASSVAQDLQDQGLIKNRQAFELYVRLIGAGGKLQAGVYRIAKASDVPTIVGKLTTGKTDTFSITFLPGNTLAKHRKALLDAGYTAAEVDAALSKKYSHPLLAGKPDSADLEGYIYGETYKMPADATVEQVIERTFDEFYKVVSRTELVKKLSSRGLSLYQGITLASIVQREIGGHDKDEALVAGVFYNRLQKGMNLGSDVTYQYIADKTGVPRDPALQSDYNTRIHAGLPPGPIASPGEGALRAVADPTKSDYLFFLSGDDNITYFGVTDADHERNIRDHCQKKCQIL